MKYITRTIITKEVTYYAAMPTEDGTSIDMQQLGKEYLDKEPGSRHIMAWKEANEIPKSVHVVPVCKDIERAYRMSVDDFINHAEQIIVKEDAE